MKRKKSYSFSDDSGDKKYFTMVPNVILNHSTAIDQAVYLQMKRYGGEKGECFVSKRKLMKKLGIGWKTLKKSINYLLDKSWISCCGVKLVETPGGKQEITKYKVNDIWKLNIEHYEGVANGKHLKPKVLPKGDKGVSNGTPRCSQLVRKEDNTEEDIEENSLFSFNEIIKGRGNLEKHLKHLTKGGELK